MARPLRLRQASAYYRLAAKATKAGNYAQAEHYRDRADRLVAEERRNREWHARRRAASTPAETPASPPKPSEGTE